MADDRTDSGGAGDRGGVDGGGTRVRPADRAPLESVRIIGHDGLHARLVCLLCPATQPTYGVNGSLAGVVKWATQHYQFLHETQVAARD